MKVLGINAVFHDSSAALIVDGETVAAAEEERFSRRKHGKPAVPFAAWELPEHAIRWCLHSGGVRVADLDAVAYSYDPSLAPEPATDLTAEGWEGLRTLYAQRAPQFLRTVLPDLDPDAVRFVPHHLAHAASACIAAPPDTSSVLVLDGRGERSAYLAGRWDGRELDVLATRALPHSLGLLYEDATAHLGFRRSSDEYKVMALASYGTPRHLPLLREQVTTEPGGFAVGEVDWSALAPPRPPGGETTSAHADLAASLQARLEEVLLSVVRWLHAETGDETLTMAGGVALNCVANSRLYRDGPFADIWVQPAAGDSGTALGAALHVACAGGDATKPFTTAALGPAWSDDELRGVLDDAAVPFSEPADLAGAAADVLVANGVVAWFQGRSEFGPRALGHRSLLADARDPDNLQRLNDVKGREAFRPVAPMVLRERAEEVFADGPFPSPYMLFTHRVRQGWHDRIPAAIHVDGTARIQTVDRAEEPRVAALLEAVEQRTGVPVVINTSLNTAGRPMVDSPRDALELFGSAPVDALVLGPAMVRRATLFDGPRR